MTESAELSVILFKINNIKFAIDHNEIISVISSSEITNYTLDNIIYKNEKIKLIKLTKEITSNHTLFIIKILGKKFSFFVDNILNNIKIPYRYIHQLPKIIENNLDNEFLWGIGIVNDEMYYLV